MESLMKTIEKDWDIGGTIPSDANPSEEFELWKEFAESHPKWWNGTEFTLEDFEKYISEVVEFGIYDY